MSSARRTFFRLLNPFDNTSLNSRAGAVRAVAALFTAAALASCAGAPQTRALLAATPDQLPAAVELRNTPFFPQQRYQCGPAALATVLAAHGRQVSPDQLVDSVFVPDLKGSLPEEIAAAARRRGMLAYRLAPSLQSLLAELAAGNPVLVFQNLGLESLARWHFAVAIGYDLAAPELVLRSGTIERRSTELATFERTWARSGYWALVILPAGDIPATAGVMPYLRAAHDLETSADPAAARSAYRAAARRWPDQPAAWLAYGNSLYAAAAYADAEAAFRRAVTLQPARPRGWNNLAYALLKTDCASGARQAALCAQQLAPGDPAWRATVSEINALAVGDDAPGCRPVDCAGAAGGEGGL
jgi:tetratricopeptide (TPR) repeat protein